MLGLVTRLLGARLAASVGIKLLPKVPVTEGVNEKQIPVHISRANMQLQDGLPNLAPPAFQTQNHTLRRWFARIVQ